jgi:hypothetical protein
VCGGMKTSRFEKVVGFGLAFRNATRRGGFFNDEKAVQWSLISEGGR